MKQHHFPSTPDTTLRHSVCVMLPPPLNIIVVVESLIRDFIDAATSTHPGPMAGFLPSPTSSQRSSRGEAWSFGEGGTPAATKTKKRSLFYTETRNALSNAILRRPTSSSNASVPGSFDSTVNPVFGADPLQFRGLKATSGQQWQAPTTSVSLPQSQEEAHLQPQRTYLSLLIVLMLLVCFPIVCIVSFVVTPVKHGFVLLS